MSQKACYISEAAKRSLPARLSHAIASLQKVRHELGSRLRSPAKPSQFPGTQGRVGGRSSQHAEEGAAPLAARPADSIIPDSTRRWQRVPTAGHAWQSATTASTHMWSDIFCPDENPYSGSLVALFRSGCASTHAMEPDGRVGWLRFGQGAPFRPEMFVTVCARTDHVRSALFAKKAPCDLRSVVPLTLPCTRTLTSQNQTRVESRLALTLVVHRLVGDARTEACTRDHSGTCPQRPAPRRCTALRRSRRSCGLLYPTRMAGRACSAKLNGSIRQSSSGLPHCTVFYVTSCGRCLHRYLEYRPPPGPCAFALRGDAAAAQSSAPPSSIRIANRQHLGPCARL